MFCPNCGKETGDAAFCPNCGSQVTPPEQTPVAPEVVPEAQPVETPVAEAPVAQPEAAPAAVGEPAGFAPVAQPPVAPPKKKLPLKLILLPIIAVVLVVAIVLGVVAIGIVSSPQVKLANGVKKLLLDAESFDFNVEYSHEYTRTEEVYDYYYGYYTDSYSGKNVSKVDGSIAWGKDLLSSSYYVNYTQEYYDDGMLDEEYNYYLVSNQGETLITGSYMDEMGISFNAPNAYNFVKENQDDVADYFFGMDAADFADELDDEAGITIETAFDWIENIISNKKINENLLGEIYDEWVRQMIEENTDLKVEELPDYKTIKKVATKFITKGISDEAFEIREEYKEDGITKYAVTIHYDILVADLYEFLEGNKDLKDFLATDIGEDLLDELDEAVDEGYFEDEETEFIVGLSKGYLAYIEYVEEDSWNYGYGSESYEYEDTIKVTFSNFNKSADFGGKYDEVYAKADDWFKFEDLDDIDEFYDIY